MCARDRSRLRTFTQVAEVLLTVTTAAVAIKTMAFGGAHALLPTPERGRASTVCTGLYRLYLVRLVCRQ